MPSNGRIPGIAQVPMPPAAPKARVKRELVLQMTTNETLEGTGVRIKVGAAWAVTLFPRDLRRIGPMLGMDYAKAINERNAAQSALANRTQERDLARTNLETRTKNFTDATDDLRQAREERDSLVALQDIILEHIPADFQPLATRGTRIACWLGDLEGKLAVAQGNLEEARAQRGEWERAAGRNLRDFRASEAKVAKLNGQLDRMAIDLGKTESGYREYSERVQRLLNGRFGWLVRRLWRKAGEGLPVASPAPVAGEEAGS
jgi:hypothetical protein